MELCSYVAVRMEICSSVLRGFRMLLFTDTVRCYKTLRVAARRFSVLYHASQFDTYILFVSITHWRCMKLSSIVR